MSKPQKKKDKRTKTGKRYIDFKELSKDDLGRLRTSWHNDAMAFEIKLQNIQRSPNVSDSELNTLWNRGSVVWRKVKTLEDWLHANRKDVVSA